jgi:hypothetical protein
MPQSSSYTSSSARPYTFSRLFSLSFSMIRLINIAFWESKYHSPVLVARATFFKFVMVASSFVYVDPGRFLRSSTMLQSAPGTATELRASWTTLCGARGATATRSVFAFIFINARALQPDARIFVTRHHRVAHPFGQQFMVLVISVLHSTLCKSQMPKETCRCILLACPIDQTH